MLVRFRQRQPQGPWIIAQTPRPGNKLTRLADGTEPLVIKIIRHARLDRLREDLGDAIGLSGWQVAEHDFEAVGKDIFGIKGVVDLAQVFQLEIRLPKIPPGPVFNRQVLPRRGVPILQSAHRDALPRHAPCAAQGIDGFGSAKGTLGQAIQGVRSLAERGLGELFHAKVVRRLFEFHRGR